MAGVKRCAVLGVQDPAGERDVHDGADGRVDAGAFAEHPFVGARLRAAGVPAKESVLEKIL